LLILPVLFSVTVLRAAYALDIQEVVAGLQQRYRFVDTVSADFQQTFMAPGMNQVESGVFWMKKPGLMRWEYQLPETKLFVTDGRESFFYVPEDRQVIIQPFSASDMHSTPLEFLMGRGEIEKDFVSAWESELTSKVEGTFLIRLVPRKAVSEYSFLVLEVDRRNYDLRRVIVHEVGGSTSEFLLTKLATNVKVDDKEFRFKIPKGAEVIRMESR